LALVAVACAAAGGLVLFAVSRTWLVEVVQRPAPLEALHTPRTGGSLLPALPAMGLVMLAGAGALFATRGMARRAVGALVLVAGVVAAILAAVSLLRAGVTPVWPVLAFVGAALAVAAGGFTIVRGASWPALGRRYDRPARPVHSGQAAAPAGNDRDLWDALDRGEDPTR